MVKTSSSPNVVMYTTLIKGFKESKMVEDAFHVLNLMKSEGYAPNLVLCNVLIDCLSKVGRYDNALDVFVSLQTQNMTPEYLILIHSVLCYLPYVCLRGFLSYPS